MTLFLGLSSRPSRKVICNSKSLFLFPKAIQTQFEKAVGNKKYNGVSHYFSIFSEGSLGLSKS